MILLIDNYDSFSYNLYQLIGGINPNIIVRRNDAISIAEIVVLQPTHIVLSPGPGKPAHAGICERVIEVFTGHIPILGVCLGHQAICEVFGATIGYAKELMHGKTSEITINTKCKIFRGLPKTINVGRYHSLAAGETTIPDTLAVTATTQDGCVMAVQHKSAEVFGVQFHPESILTPNGKTIVQNFLLKDDV
jgi:anthranilate synthase component 2